jgi:hypothetical protein
VGERPGVPERRPDERPSERPDERPGDRERGDRYEDRQDNMQDRREFRQNAWQEYGYRDYDEWYEDRWKYAMGASLSVTTFRALTCQPTVVLVGSVSYYQCASTWYRRTYMQGSTTYVVVSAPAGY